MKLSIAHATGKALFKAADTKDTCWYVNGFLAFEGGGLVYTNTIFMVVVDMDKCTGESVFLYKSKLALNGTWLTAQKAKTVATLDSEDLKSEGDFRFPPWKSIVETSNAVDLVKLNVEELIILLTTFRDAGVKVVQVRTSVDSTCSKPVELVSVRSDVNVYGMIMPTR